MANPLEMLEASCTRLVRRMVSLPRAIMDQGLDLMRNHHHQFPPPNVPVYHHHPPLDHSISNHLQPDLSFLSCFEQHFGIIHPFFYALVVQFLDANFVSWGGVADQGEGLHMATTLRAASYPFCAVVAPGSGHNLDVVQQMEGPVTPEELVEILQTILEEQQSAFSNTRAQAEEKRKDDIRLIQEQDAAFAASLQADQEKMSKLENKAQHEENATANGQHSQILIRFPNGERKEKTFSSLDKMEAIFKFIDSLGIPGVGENYRLVSSFPRKLVSLVFADGSQSGGPRLSFANGVWVEQTLSLKPSFKQVVDDGIMETKATTEERKQQRLQSNDLSNEPATSVLLQLDMESKEEEPFFLPLNSCYL
ncbi:unnamed protein product [Lactuca saligna]|uniref:UBX domain-containing protein n=1 Tax=Lactuca saligna TaxID=75948 RepID=A0AA35VT55_LACSI|nr:unnamed protein product [Lactuca saligna]